MGTKQSLPHPQPGAAPMRDFILNNPAAYMPLIAQAVAGDSQAERQLFEAIETCLTRLLQRFIPHYHDRQELVQNIIEEIWEKKVLSRYDIKKGLLITFIRQLAQKRLIDRVRRCKRAKAEILMENLDRQTARELSPFESAAQTPEEIQEAMGGLAAHFPLDHPFIGLVEEGMNSANQGIKGVQLARRLAIPEPTMKSRLHRGRLELQERGVTPRSYFDPPRQRAGR
ncbi:MAG: RNA polymerase sigma factor [Dongiaceae bacterium]